MDCETLTKVNTSSLYKNGRLITQTSVAFIVDKCNNVDLKICTDVSCLRNRRVLRVCFVTTNIGSNTIESGLVRIIVTPKCCRCNCNCNSQCRVFPINDLRAGCTQKDCIFLPLNCYANYKIRAQVEVNGTILKEDCATI